MNFLPRGKHQAVRLHRLFAGSSARPVLSRGIAQENQLQKWQPHQSRSYATQGEGIQARYREGSNASRFSLADYEACMRRPHAKTFQNLSPAEYYRYFNLFVAAMRANKGMYPQTARELQGAGLSGEHVYEMGTIVHGSRNLQNIPYDAWAVASFMDSSRGTLSLTKNLIMSGQYGRHAFVRNVESRFRQLVATGRDPNALALQGMLLYMNKSYESCAAHLEKLLKTHVQTFEWEQSAKLHLACAYAKLGRQEEAKRLIDMTGTSTDVSLQDDVTLGKTIRPLDPDRAEKHLWRPAFFGDREALTHLGEISMERSTTGTQEASKDEHLLMALEWFRLADRSVDH